MLGEHLRPDPNLERIQARGGGGGGGEDGAAPECPGRIDALVGRAVAHILLVALVNV